MSWFVVYRHGWSEKNQSPDRGQPGKMAVARIDADNPEEACLRARPDITLEEGQHLSAEAAEEVDAREAAMNRTARSQHSSPAGEPDFPGTTQP